MLGPARIAGRLLAEVPYHIVGQLLHICPLRILLRVLPVLGRHSHLGESGHDLIDTDALNLTILEVNVVVELQLAGRQAFLSLNRPLGGRCAINAARCW